MALGAASAYYGRMATYQLRLFQNDRTGSGTDPLAETVEFEAASDADAIAKAPMARVTRFDNSDYAVLFDEAGHKIADVAKYA